MLQAFLGGGLDDGGAGGGRSVYVFSETSLKKTNLLLVSGYQLEIATELGMWAYVHFLSQDWNSIMPGPMQSLCMWPQFQ